MSKKLKEWFDGELAGLLAEKISKVSPKFPSKTFIAEVSEGVNDLELKDRVELMADLLYDHLEGDYTDKLKVFHGIMGPENENETGMFTEYYWLMPVAKLVEKYGVPHFEESMQIIEEITKRNTGEYCIRPFLMEYPQRTLARMVDWSKSSNFHLRRLASEGARPKLPWAKKLDLFIDDPDRSLIILEQLKDDPIKFVQKSVANCLNDLAKFHPEWLIRTMNRWSKGASKDRKWVIRNALRSLIKSGNDQAIRLEEEL